MAPPRTRRSRTGPSCCRTDRRGRPRRGPADGQDFVRGRARGSHSPCSSRPPARQSASRRARAVDRRAQSCFVQPPFGGVQMPQLHCSRPSPPRSGRCHMRDRPWRAGSCRSRPPDRRRPRCSRGARCRRRPRSCRPHPSRTTRGGDGAPVAPPRRRRPARRRCGHRPRRPHPPCRCCRRPRRPARATTGRAAVAGRIVRAGDLPGRPARRIDRADGNRAPDRAARWPESEVGATAVAGGPAAAGRPAAARRPAAAATLPRDAPPVPPVEPGIRGSTEQAGRARKHQRKAQPRLRISSDHAS